MNATKMIYVALAENNEQGDPQGTVARIDFCYGGDYLIQLEADFEDPEKIETGELGGLKIHGEIFSTGYRREWVGNMIWNEYQISTAEAVRLLNTLKASGCWNLDEAVSELFEKFEGKGLFTVADLEAAKRVLED